MSDAFTVSVMATPLADVSLEGPQSREISLSGVFSDPTSSRVCDDFEVTVRPAS